MFPDLRKLENLELRFFAERNVNLVEVFDFLYRVPNLEEFVLDLVRKRHPTSAAEHRFEKIAGSPHRSLKVLKISGYFGMLGELELVIYCLKYVIALERIIVDPGKISWSRRPLLETEIGNEQKRWDLIRQQLQEVMPSHIELVVLNFM